MKVITEAVLRDELGRELPDTYYIPEGKILSPAAREYLQQRKIKISKDPAPEMTDDNAEKPEHMTLLHGNILVPKDHPRIVFRGKLDSLQSLIVLAQVEIAERGKEKLAEELEDILAMLREMMRADALELPFEKDLIIGFTHTELHDRSHNPMKYYQIEPMLLPHYRMGLEYALLNQLRSSVRETEAAAVAAFRSEMKVTRRDLVEGLNRLSSAVHVMMCRYLAGEYESGMRKPEWK